MQVIHHIGEAWNSSDVLFLKTRGIDVKEGIFSYIKVDSATYGLIAEKIMRPHIMHAIMAEFTKKELDEVEWVALTALKPFGYPQPEETFDYIYDVYETSRYCEKCGIVGGPQKGPFRIKSDKTKLDAFQLGWTFDQIFVKRTLYDDLFAKFGIRCRPVLIHRTGKESSEVVQLDLQECEWDFDMADMTFEICPVCGRKKYLRRITDFLPPLRGTPPKAMFRGREYFGSGGEAFRLIYLSQEIRQELVKRKITRWNQFEPVRN